jgi:hypothetical protein
MPNSAHEGRLNVKTDRGSTNSSRIARAYHDRLRCAPSLWKLAPKSPAHPKQEHSPPCGYAYSALVPSAAILRCGLRSRGMTYPV